MTAHQLFVANVKRLLRGKEMTPTDLAKRIGCTQPAVHSWLINRGSPSMKMVTRVADALQVGPHHLFNPVASRQFNRPA